MHPILANRRHLALYLMAWLPVIALLTVAMVMTGWGDWMQSLLLTFPMVVVYAFLCLSAWYPCRAMPLGGERAEMTLVTHLASAVLSALLWVGMAWLLAEGFKRSALYAGEADLTAEHTGIIFTAIVGLRLAPAAGLPTLPLALLMLGGVYFYEKKYAEAELVYERLMQTEPGSGMISIALFNTLWKQGRHEEAAEEIRRFIAEADPVKERATIEQYAAISKAIAEGAGVLEE